MTTLTTEEKAAVRAAFQSALDEVCHWEWVGDVCTGSSMYAKDVARIMCEVMANLGIETPPAILASRNNDPLFRRLEGLQAENDRLRERVARSDDTAGDALREVLRDVASRAHAALAK